MKNGIKDVLGDVIYDGPAPPITEEFMINALNEHRIFPGQADKQVNKMVMETLFGEGTK